MCVKSIQSLFRVISGHPCYARLHNLWPYLSTLGACIKMQRRNTIYEQEWQSTHSAKKKLPSVKWQNFNKHANMTQTLHFVIWIWTLRFYILELRVWVPYDKTLDTKCAVRAEGSHAWFSSGENPGERPLFEADFISQGHHQLYRYLYQLELRKNTLQNVALILFHGVSPNPLAPKVMVPKLTSRQKMFAF